MADILPCDPEIYKNGRVVLWTTGPADTIERWVRAIAASSNTRIDWHYFAGRVRILHLGDDASFNRAYDALNNSVNDISNY